MYFYRIETILKTFNTTIKFIRSCSMSVLVTQKVCHKWSGLCLRFNAPLFSSWSQIFTLCACLLAGLPSTEPLCGRHSAVVCWPCTAPASSLQPACPPALPPTSGSPWSARKDHPLCSPLPGLHFHQCCLWAWAAVASPWGVFCSSVLSQWNVLHFYSWRLCYQAEGPENYPNAPEEVWTPGGSQEGKKHPGVWL